MVNIIILLGGPSVSGVLRPLCGDIPPPLFPIAGLETIYHQIYAASLIGNVLKEIVLIGFYEKSHFASFMEKIKESLGVTCRYIQEEKQNGTGGTIAKNIEEIFSDKNEYALVIHCNICSNFPIVKMLEFHKSHNKMATVMSCLYPKQDSSVKYGNFVKDLTTNELKHHAEKPEHYIGNLINCGVYIFSKSSMGAFLKARQLRAKKIEELEKSKKNLYLTGNSNDLNKDFLSLENDLLMEYAGKGEIFIYQLEANDFWKKIHSPQDALECNQLYLSYYDKNPEIYSKSLKIQQISNQNNVLIHLTAEIDKTAKIGANVSIGSGCEIGKGVRIVNSIILDGCKLKDYCCVINSIVCWNSVLGYWCRVEGNAKVTLLGVGVTVENEKAIRNCVVLPHQILDKNHFNEILF